MSIELAWRVEQRERLLGAFKQRPGQKVWFQVQWRDRSGTSVSKDWLSSLSADEALQKSLVGRPLGAVVVQIFDVLGNEMGNGAVSQEGYWITRSPPQKPKEQPRPVELAKWVDRKLTRFQFRLRVTALAGWTIANFIGCQSTVQRTAKSVHVRTQNGSYRRRPPGGKQADDRINRGTLWMRVLIFLAWASSSWWFYQRAFMEKRKAP